MYKPKPVPKPVPREPLNVRNKIGEKRRHKLLGSMMGGDKAVVRDIAALLEPDLAAGIHDAPQLASIWRWICKEEALLRRRMK